MTRPQRGCCDDSGSATVLVLGIAVVVISAAVAVLMLGAAVCARHSAQAAADLAAIAAAQRIGVDGTGCDAAAAVASANGAVLSACDIEIAGDGWSGSVEVVVSRAVGSGALGEWTATARARAERVTGGAP